MGKKCVNIGKIRELIEEWRKEDYALMMKITYMNEHEFAAEEFVLSKVRDALVKRRIELEDAMGETK